MGKQKVVVLGGGMGGLAVAHELIERDFEVEVYELLPVMGGKARSIPFEGSEGPGKAPLPGEHGFRFFPGFYKHINNTMSRIPASTVSPTSCASSPIEGRTVLDNLVPADAVEIAQQDPNPDIVVPSRRGVQIQGVTSLSITELLSRNPFGIQRAGIKHFGQQMLEIATTCPERRLAELEGEIWWKYIGGGKYGDQYDKLLARGLTQSLVAMRAQEASARTVGTILLQILQLTVMRHHASDRVLNGPTSDVWIDPWVHHLNQRGVKFFPNHKVMGFTMADGRIASVKLLHDPKGAKEEKAVGCSEDLFVSALPVEVMRYVANEEMEQVAPELKRLWDLNVEWMNGIVFYLNNNEKLVRGHSILTDSSWALTSISQKQFWEGIDLSAYGNGKTAGILSVDISNWEAPGQHTTVYTADKCKRFEVAQETWAQIKAHWSEINDDDLIEGRLTAGGCSWFLDPAIVSRADHPPKTPVENVNDEGFHERGRQTVRDFCRTIKYWKSINESLNLEPLLVNTVGSWNNRPEAMTAISNLFLASDYVKTNTDLATMEAANEAARRAVNEILDTTKSSARRCQLWPLREFWFFAPFRWLDWVFLRLFGAGGFRIRWKHVLYHLGLLVLTVLMPFKVKLRIKQPGTLPAARISEQPADPLESVKAH